MFMRRRRPLLGAAMIGGAGVLAGRSAARSADREADQDQRIDQLEATQQAPAPAAAPAPTAGGQDDLVAKLKELSGLVDSGVLTKDEFEAAKRKLLAA
ncbi:MAG TPA: SHOCT domain-containing protein [Solirubrobacteraceae bacterium]|jgi:hypothetical protein|nr:SHOCT domain-containing protein [Solirubrobacteraceae bacterium]